MKASKRRNDGYSVYQHKKSGRWEWMVTIGYDQNGKQLRVRGYEATRELAVATAQKVAIAHRSGGFVPMSKDSTVSEFLSSWMEQRVIDHKEPKTVSFYEANIRVHLNPAFGRVALRKLTVQHVQKLINEKSKSGLSSSTVRGMVATLRAALQIAWKEGLIEQNVAQRVTLPKLERNEPVYLDPEQSKRLIEASKGHAIENLVIFALATGVRIGEASGLTWHDVDFEKGTIKISSQLQRIDGELKLKTVKSRSSRRVLAMDTLAKQALQSEFSRQLLVKAELGDRFNLTNLVFLNSENRPLDPKYVHKHLNLLCEKAGVPSISFHKLRHTAATLMVGAGVELHQVKEQLGHSQISLTSDLYSHSLSESQRRAASKLDQVLRSGKLSD